jgi:hypothetical protein
MVEALSLLDKTALFFEEFLYLDIMSLIRGNKFNSIMLECKIIPTGKGFHPSSSLLQVVKGFFREGRTIFNCSRNEIDAV